MVQKKVLNKLIIHPKNTLKTDKIHANTKLSLQNYDSKTKVADLKAIKMKKSRSIKRSDVTHVVSKTPSPNKDKPSSCNSPNYMKESRFSKRPGLEFGSDLSTPTKTLSPKKLSPYNSPNYMKSTSSSELHKAEKSLSKTCSLNKVRTLTKAPSFKHSRITHKKAVLCENYDAQRATCSSTLKEFKFPSYLKLTSGATEAQGTSVMKVCPYNYCSLNGHRHSSAPPLKTFLASKRRMLKTLKNVVPEVVSDGKRKRSEVNVTDDESVMLEDVKDVFFVEIHVPRCDLSEVSEVGFLDDVNLSDTNFVSEENTDEIKVSVDEPETVFNFVDIPRYDPPRVSDTDLQGDVNVSDMNFTSEEIPNQESPFEGYNSASDLETDSNSSVSLDQLFGEVSDMEWEEGKILAFPDEKVEVPVQKDDEIEYGFELEKFFDGKLLPCIYDEIIMEFLQFSDADTASDSESTQSDGDYHVGRIADDETICTVEVEQVSSKGGEVSFSSPIEEVTTAENEANNDESDKEISVLKDSREEETIPTDISVEDITWEATYCQQLTDENNVFSVKDANSEEEYDSAEVKVGSTENYVEEGKTSEAEDIIKAEKEEALSINVDKAEQVRKGISDRGGDLVDELLDCSSKLRKSVRCKKTNDDCDEDKDFNPRPPNFLPVEPEEEPEKVDLRHQDMDERRNAEDWMLDHALQKTVGQLAPARKRKVALLVEAFEAVLPIPKYEPQMRRNLLGYTLPRPVQACR